jgi:hypothetical protein
MSATPSTFTAAQLAAALGCRRQTMQRRLERVAPSSSKSVNGNEARAWTLAALPNDVQNQLAKAARRAGCRDAEHLLQQPCSATAIPLNRCAPASIDKAIKLRAALLPSLRRQHEPITAAEFERRGLEDFRLAFGYAITARQFRNLFRRTLRRDAGAEQWERLELYLDERPQRSAPRTMAKDRAEQFSAIESLVSACHNPAAPNESERAAIWTLVFEHCDRLIGEGRSAKQAKRLLRDFLFARVPLLAPTRDALLKAFERGFAVWQRTNGDPKALRDGRLTNTGNHDGYELPEGDRDLLIHRAVWSCGGRIAQAWRGLLRESAFSIETQARYAGKAANKSHVPHTINESVRAEVEILSEMLLGRRAFDLLKPSVSRHYDGIHSLQCLMADDLTPPVMAIVPDGRGWFRLVRGQCLVFIDFRSLRVLGWSLQPENNYNSLVIRSLCTHVFSQWRLPEILYFERGIWQRSALITGRQDALSFAEVSQGLREFGIKFIHAIRPRSKTVEGVFGKLQDLMEGEPGYTGRFERLDMPDATKRAKQLFESKQFKDDVLAGRKRIDQDFYTFDQWNARLGQLIGEYNETPQQGKILKELSPEAALEKFLNQDNPPIEITPGVRYLLAHHKEEKVVTPGGRRGDRGGGITFQVGKQTFRYFGRELAHLIGERVLAWFDPENPELLTVTDMNRRNPICVPRHQEVSALAELTGDQDLLAQELARSSGHMSHMKTRYNVLKSKFPLPSRQNLIAAHVIDTGQQIDEQKETFREKKRARAREKRQLKELADSALMGAEIELGSRVRQSETAMDSAKSLTAFMGADLDDRQLKELGKAALSLKAEPG